MMTFETRSEMLEALPKGGNICEIGVFKGDFAQQILDICKPNSLFLIDTFTGKVGSGDKDGNNFESYNGADLHNMVQERFKNNNNVYIIKNTSDFLLSFQNNCFDIIYIDANHSYEHCSKDLQVSFEAIRNNGFICGHDYRFIFEKTGHKEYCFGVNKAVNDFCKLYNQTIMSEALDGCTSYCIKINK